MYNAEILLDSINPNGTRLTTMRVTMPRFILAELNTHRKLSKNAASSRAISVERRIKMVRENGFVPDVFGLNKRGMQAEGEVEDPAQADSIWRDAMHSACRMAERLAQLGVHKQLANRILEPFCWVTVIVSATEWNNFFNLRISPLAQPEICKVAKGMKFALDASTPQAVPWYSWHTPLSSDKEVAVGRLARVSYEAGAKTDDEEKALCSQLRQSGHWSPFEHVAQAKPIAQGSRNFDYGWIQWRAMID